MRRPILPFAWLSVRAFVPCALLLAVTTAEAVPVVAGSAAYVGPVAGGRWAGGAYHGGYYRGGYYPGYYPGYRPWVGWGGWRYGYPGYGYGWGYGWGYGYGAGLALSIGAPWGWYGPAAAYVMPSWVPMNVAVLPSPTVEELAVEAPAAPQAAPRQPGYWYYCTEPAGYYPYVNQCSRPWIAVEPNSR